MEDTVRGPGFLLGLALGRYMFPRRPWWLALPRNPSLNFHTLKTQQQGLPEYSYHQNTRKNKTETASVTVVRLLEELL